MFEINIQKSTCRLCYFKVIKGNLTPIIIAFLSTLIMYNRVSPVDHSPSVRALASCKPHQGVTARNSCIWNDRASRVYKVAREEKARQTEREREQKRETRGMRNDGVDVDDNDDDDSKESHLRLNFKFSPTNERFSDDGE